MNVRHFHEKLGEHHGIELSYTWVKQALQGAGLVAKGGKRGCIASVASGVRCPGSGMNIGIGKATPWKSQKN